MHHIEMDLDGRVLDLMDDYSTLHAAVLDMVMSLRTMAQVDLLAFTKLVILTLIHDSLQENEEEETRRLIASAKADRNFDPLPNFTIDELNKMISQINKKLSILDFEINQSKDMDMPNLIIYTFINKKGTGSIKLSTEFTDKSIELVKAAIDRIFNIEYVNENSVGSVTYNVTHMAMINHIRDESKGGLSYDEAEQLVATLELQGWLERYHDKLTLSLRGLIELQGYLIDTYKLVQDDGSISVCFGCEQIITRGFYCPNNQCYIRMHKNCKNLVKSSRETDSCPNDHCNESLTNYNIF